MRTRFFDFYWSVYVPDHSAPLNRWVHFLSNICALASCGAGLLLWNETLFALGIWFQLGPPYLGHILFEKTHRSIDQSPILAAIGSWYTTSQILLGRQCVTHGPRPPSVFDAREALERHGRDWHAFMAVEPGLQTWGDDDGAVAYVQHDHTRVAVTGPIADPARARAVADAFVADAREHGADVAFFATADGLGEGYDAVPIGLVPVWHPAHWDACIASSRKLRNRLRRGQRERIRVREGHGDVQAIVAAAEARRSLPPMGFMSTVELDAHADARRIFLAEVDGGLVGFAACVPVPARNGWLLEDLMLADGAPAGTSETLIDAVMRTLPGDAVSLGLVALAGLDDAHPLTPILRWARGLRGLYDFEGVRRFRAKLRPTRWEPVYLVAPGRVTGWTLLAVLRAFAGGSLLRFGLRFVARSLRTPAVALGGLGLVLAAVLGIASAVLPVWVAFLAGLVGCFVCFTPLHEAAHGLASRNRVLNEVVGHLSAWVVGGALNPYRYLHGEHHRNTDEPGADPDLWNHGPAWSLPLRWAVADVAYLVFYLRRWRSRPLRERLELGVIGVVYVALVGGAALKGWLAPLFLGWLLPARASMTLLAATFSWLPHRSGAGDSLHLAHHETPWVPFSRLRRRERAPRGVRPERAERGGTPGTAPRDRVRAPHARAA